MVYVDGFVLAVPAANRDAYQEFTTSTVPLFKELGVARFVETWGEDIPDGKAMDFKSAVMAGPDDVVLFSWLEYPSKEARNIANGKMKTDPRMADLGRDMPFDGEHMIMGGFEAISDMGEGGKAGFVDGFLLAVSTENKQKFIAWATATNALLLEHGATRTVDTWGDDIADGKLTDFKRAVQIRPDETVTYCWIEWPDKQVRDAAWNRMKQNNSMGNLPMPFDRERMIFGGFFPMLDD